MYEYDLFAVINHEGQIDTGHYTNYACFQDEVCSFAFFEIYLKVTVDIVVQIRRRKVNTPTPSSPHH